MIRCTDQGFEIKADPRPAELVMEQMQVEGEKSVASPGVHGADKGDNDDHEELQGEEV